MRIGIDVDDTICDTTGKANELLKELNMDWKKLLDLPSDEKRALLNKHIVGILSKTNILKDAKEVIDKLKDMGHTIYIITARSINYNTEIPNLTKEYLKKNEIYYDEIIFGAGTKGDVCLENKIDVMIDDNFENCMCVKNMGIKALYFNNDNIDTDELECVYNWLDIYNYFNERS